jgi:predicted enzyme related to lactoylglutathione lyase
MGERTQYTPGTFCWADVSTPDQDGAKTFYGSLFGWNFTDNPVGDGGVYSMADLDGKQVAAVSPQPKQQIDAGAPPSWNSYLWVEDADATLEQAKALGASVHAAAFDVMDAGRMGVLQDPQGAYVLLWQPKEHRGAQMVNGAGMLSWNELASPDPDASGGFYSDLLGWQVSPVEGMPMKYLMLKTAAGGTNGGIRELMPPGTPPHWLVYFGTDDIDASMAKVSELGGQQLMAAMDVGMGKIGVAQDPQGAVFALYAGEFED